MANWLIVGATSGIVQPLTREIAKRNNDMILAGRDKSEIEKIAKDIHQRYQVEASFVAFDAVKVNAEKFIDSIEAKFGELYGVIWAVGYLGNQKIEQEDSEAAEMNVLINYTKALTVLQAAASRMEKRRKGHIVAIGSVAGDRGRIKNYVYGSAKAGLHAALQGMRQRLSRHNVQVTTVKPGFVATKMTRDAEGMFLVADPKDVAKDIYKGIERKADVIYTPWFWRYIMMIIRHIPECIFKKTNV